MCEQFIVQINCKSHMRWGNNKQDKQMFTNRRSYRTISVPTLTLPPPPPTLKSNRFVVVFLLLLLNPRRTIPSVEIHQLPILFPTHRNWKQLRFPVNLPYRWSTHSKLRSIMFSFSLFFHFLHQTPPTTKNQTNKTKNPKTKMNQIVTFCLSKNRTKPNKRTNRNQFANKTALDRKKIIIMYRRI